MQTAATTYTYYPDDKPLTVTDARGATTTFTYNNRDLVTNISYSGPAPVPSPVSYGYDAAGNRTQMTDGAGSVTYVYNMLSQMTSETRQFTGLAGSFALSYDYTISGQLKSITDHTGSQASYSYDLMGRLLGVSGSGANSAPSYVANYRYRAWGAVKDFDYGDGVHQHIDYNARQQGTRLILSNLQGCQWQWQTQTCSYYNYDMTWDYNYYADGHLWKVNETNDPRFDRFYDYDHLGRLKDARTGSEARGGTTPDGPYRQTYDYDAWENTIGRTYRMWTQGTVTENVTYTNNRRQWWGYDNQGHLTGNNDGTFAYDAAGRQTAFASSVYVDVSPYQSAPALEVTQEFDGQEGSSREVLVVARNAGGDNGVLGTEGHAGLVFNVGTNAQPDHYIATGGPMNGKLWGWIIQATSGWWQTFQEAKGANWTTGETMQVPVEVIGRFFLGAGQSTVSNLQRVNSYINSREQDYNYEMGPNSNTFVHQFIDKLCGPGFSNVNSGSLTLKGY